MKDRIFPISAKLIGIIALLMVGALGGMTLLATWFFSQEIDRSVKQNTLDRAELISGKIETELRALADKGKLFSSVLEGGLVMKDRVTSLDSVFYQQDQTLLGVLVVRRSGESFTVAARSFDQGRLAKVGTSPDEGKLLAELGQGLVQAEAGGQGIRNVSPLFGYPVLALAVPRAMLEEGKAESVAVVFATMDRLSEALKSRELFVNLVTSAGGEILVHQDQQTVLAKANVRSSPIVQDSLTNSLDNKQIRYNEDGTAYLGSYKKFFGGELTVFSLVKEAQAMEGVFRIQQQNLLITVIVLSVSVLLLVFFSRSLTTPIRRLVEGTRRIAAGDFLVDIPVTTRDELGQLTTSFTLMGRGLAERERIKTAFGKFVNKEIAERVLQDDLALGGESKKVAVFFSDIRAFTEISEHLNPHQVVEFLNDYMTRMVGCVNQTHGVVDKFIGDAVMAVWGAPYSVGNDTENAVNGALMMRQALAQFNAGRGGPGKPVIRIGCGINTGWVVAGQIGSSERMEYTVIGDPVNLASRIESLNKPFRTDILISEESYALVQGIFRVEEMRRIAVKGKTAPQQVYAVLGRLDDPTCPRTLDEVRLAIGYPTGALPADLDPDRKEKKYEILE